MQCLGKTGWQEEEEECYYYIKMTIPRFPKLRGFVIVCTERDVCYLHTSCFFD